MAGLTTFFPFFRHFSFLFLTLDLYFCFFLRATFSSKEVPNYAQYLPWVVVTVFASVSRSFRTKAAAFSCLRQKVSASDKETYTN